MSLLQDHTWKAKYDSDDRDLVRDFFVPALEAARRYDRTTGFFSAPVLTLAARGIEGLVRNDGRMRLVVGCTLHAPEVEAISRGEDLRKTIEGRLGGTPLAPENRGQEAALELLSWLVARGYLEVRVAVPCTPDGKPCEGEVMFHEKAGIVEDKTGDRLAFAGSLNETAAGWTGNWESFHVFTSWGGGAEHVRATEGSFAKIWAGKSPRLLVVDVPQAVRDDLLRFLPPDGAPPRRLHHTLSSASPTPEAAIPAPPAQTPIDELRAQVWALIREGPARPGAGDRVGEATSIVTPWPHQVRAFERLYHAWPPRLLIADEVGLGKTIEAGLVVRQAWLAGRVKRVLVLAPKAVLRQWQVELREKFNLNWPIYDGQKLCWYPSLVLGDACERKVSRETWHQEPCVLVSSQLMRRADRAAELLEDAVPWDLVVLDEAHHARRRGVGSAKDKGPNQLLALMQRLRGRTQGLMLLTATPMQVDPVEVWDLLALLGLPAAWTEDAFLRFFDVVSHPNPSNEDLDWMARLFRASEQAYGGVTENVLERSAPALGKLARRTVLKALRSGAKTDLKQLDSARRGAAVRIMAATTPVARLVSRHTRELLRQYFRLGRISTPIPDRAVEDEFIEMSAEERHVYEAVETYISTTYDAASAAERNAVGFVMTTYRRRLASSFAALASTLEGRLERVGGPQQLQLEEDASDDETSDDPMDAEDVARLEAEAASLEEKDDIRGLLVAIRRLPEVDTKARVLARILEQLRAAGHEKVMVFTQYTDTLDFLREHLVRACGLEVVCFSGRGGEVQERSGSWKLVSREDVKRTFRDGRAQVLLCTDAASEGLNFQFCGALVNYDMPWNPMRVEQRIGRIDRLGQRFSNIRIRNLHYEHTVETDVYRVLRQRIGLFTKFVGRLQPILATLPRQISDAVLRGARGAPDAAVQALEAQIRERGERGFDLDAVTDAELAERARPEPLYDLDALDVLVRRPELLPPGMQVEPLGPREYRVSLPGMEQPLRVTTSAAFYEEHPGSCELWSPGSPLFPEVDATTAADAESAAVRTLAQLLGAQTRRSG